MISEAFAERCPEQPKTLGGYAKFNDQVGCPTSRSSVSGELQTLRELINAGHEYATMLEQKTAPIRRMTPLCEAERERNPLKSGSELTEELIAQNARLSALLSRISALIEEIDL